MWVGGVGQDRRYRRKVGVRTVIDPRANEERYPDVTNKLNISDELSYLALGRWVFDHLHLPRLPWAM